MNNLQLKNIRHIVGYNVKLVDYNSGEELTKYNTLKEPYGEWYVVRIGSCYEMVDFHDSSFQIDTKNKILLSQYPFFEE